jgi:hypothetical protein
VAFGSFSVPSLLIFDRGGPVPVLIDVCAAKGGAGATVVVAGLAAMLAARGDDVLVVDLDGDLPAVLGLAEPTVGLGDWLAAGPDVSVGSLGRVEVATGTDRLAVLPLGSTREWSAERNAALVSLLAVEHRTVVVDGGVVGTEHGPLGDLRGAVREASGSTVLVTRACYLALRRALRHDARPDGVVLVREQGRALDAGDVARVLNAPVVAKLDLDPAIHRLVDAGLFATRPPRALTRALRRVA